LTSITIPASVDQIADSVFRGCSSLQVVTFDGLTNMDEDTHIFDGCTSLEAIKVPYQYWSHYAGMLPDELCDILIGY
jgi:hypothetical protein